MSAIDELRETMARLRSPDGCPWDREQNHQTLCEPLIDETCELLDTIDRNDMEHMCEELGDVLLQVVFHAQLADERGDFNFDDVAKGINEKLVRRHPHVFGDVDLQDSDAVLKQWEAIKAAEKKNGPESNGIFKHLPPRLPAIMFAADVARQIRKKELKHEALTDQEELDLIAEDLSEEEVGEMLYRISAACDKAGIDGESALRRYASKLVHDIEKRG